MPATRLWCFTRDAIATLASYYSSNRVHKRPGGFPSVVALADIEAEAFTVGAVEDGVELLKQR